VARPGSIRRDMPRTLIALLVLAALAATTASATPASTSSVIVHRGQTAQISFSLSGSRACQATIRYADNAAQYTGIKHPSGGRISWTVRVPTNAAEGFAHWTVRCGATVRRSGTWQVAAATSTAPALPRVLVANSGYSQRPDEYDTGSRVSYGVLLKNTSATRDAQNIYMLVNFVGAGGQLLGSATQTIGLVAANQTYAFGSQMNLRTQLPVTSLEVTVRVATGAPALAHPLPHFANVIIAPDSHHEWVSEIDGEIVNDTSPQTLTAAKLSLVVFDANGNIVGGSSSSSYTPLPSGSRMVFLAQSGFDSIPFAKAASVTITVEPSYQTG
jgi:hypothetical protein